MAQRYSEHSNTAPSSLKSIKACLDHLWEEAESQSLALTANLIEAASQAIADEIAERSTLAHYGAQRPSLKPEHN